MFFVEPPDSRGSLHEEVFVSFLSGFLMLGALSISDVDLVAHCFFVNWKHQTLLSPYFVNA